MCQAPANEHVAGEKYMLSSRWEFPYWRLVSADEEDWKREENVRPEIQCGSTNLENSRYGLPSSVTWTPSRTSAWKCVTWRCHPTPGVEFNHWGPVLRIPWLHGMSLPIGHRQRPQQTVHSNHEILWRIAISDRTPTMSVRRWCKTGWPLWSSGRPAARNRTVYVSRHWTAPPVVACHCAAACVDTQQQQLSSLGGALDVICKGSGHQ